MSCDCNDCGETMFEESINKLTEAIEEKTYDCINEICFDAIMHCIRRNEPIVMEFDGNSVIFNRIENFEDIRYILPEALKVKKKT